LTKKYIKIEENDISIFHNINKMEALNADRYNNNFTDIRILVNDDVGKTIIINVHRAVLATQCTYFADLLKDPKIREITIDDDLKGIEHLIDWLYSPDSNYQGQHVDLMFTRILMKYGFYKCRSPRFIGDLHVESETLGDYINIAIGVIDVENIMHYSEIWNKILELAVKRNANLYSVPDEVLAKIFGYVPNYKIAGSKES